MPKVVRNTIFDIWVLKCGGPSPIPTGSHFWFRELKIWIFDDFSTLDRFRVRGSISYCTRMDNPWVLSTGTAPRPSKQFFRQKSDFLEVWGWPITVQALAHSRSKSRFWARKSMETLLECSDWLHIAPGCTTDDYYELRKFQDHPSSFTHKIRDFGGAGGGRLHLPSPPALIFTSESQNQIWGSKPI